MSSRALFLSVIALGCTGSPTGGPSSSTAPSEGAAEVGMDAPRLSFALSGEVQAELEPCG